MRMLVFTPHVSVSVAVVGEVSSLRAGQRFSNEEVALTDQPEGSSAEVVDGCFTPTHVGFHKVAFGTHPQSGYRVREVFAVSADTVNHREFQGRSLEIFRSLINDPSARSQLDVAALASDPRPKKLNGDYFSLVPFGAATWGTVDWKDAERRAG